MTPRDEDLTIDAMKHGTTLGVVTPPPSGPSRFTPGSIIVGRYRLVALLGKGGMGEVYRADDLTLDQPVALKFLSEGVAANDARLAQFHNELRIARQVSHKNVCRLYDLGDTDGRRFLTMEYVDGEDLSSSLRRFGRMPPDKAIQIARQLCAGVAAAHERGVLHRDLKPANVMLDGNGDVRITDFGIATAAADAGGGGVVGTPQYMAPELLAGKPASVKSDIYALGLILFEVFTGKRAYEAKTLGELKQLHDTGTVVTPSSLVHDLDPAVERVILRCLEKDPERRPASALTVAASLPGGDPLAAALAAGETPSPELLVAAGESQAMAVGPALAMAVGFLIAVGIAIFGVNRMSLTGYVPLPVPRDVLADRAEQVIRRLGYSSSDIADRALGFQFAQDYLRWEQRSGAPDWWNRLRQGRPPAVRFWYRTSPREFVPMDPAGRVSPVNPPMTISGMHQMFLDAEGRLIEFHSVPPQVVGEAGAAPDPPWPALFELAGLDLKAFTPTAVQWIPRDFVDASAAWEGSMPGRSDVRVRIEAASYRNRAVSFQIVWPWTQPVRQQVQQRTTLQRVSDALSVAVIIVLVCGGVLLARHNLRANRADRRGAARLAIAITLIALLGTLLTITHVAEPIPELNLQLMGSLAFAVRSGGLIWIFYLAMEPYARRFWPDSLLGWTRLVSGRLRDPRVGREMLIGLAVGGAMTMVALLPLVLMMLGRRVPQLPFGGTLLPLVGVPLVAARWITEIMNAVQSALAVTMILVVMRLLLKRAWLAMAANGMILLLAVNNGSAISGSWMDVLNVVMFIVLITIAIYRFGLVAMATALFVSNTLGNMPLTPNLSVWWSTPTLLTVGMLVALTWVAFSAARTGQPLFGTVLKD